MLEALVLCMATNVYHEARGESFLGQIAVNQVVLNRATKKKQDPCKVVYAKSQFSWTIGKGTPEWNKRFGVMKDKNAVARAYLAVFASMVIPDVTRGATFYHADYVKPHWADDFAKTSTIGTHMFYANNTRKDVKKTYVFAAL